MRDRIADICGGEIVPAYYNCEGAPTIVLQEAYDEYLGWYVGAISDGKLGVARAAVMALHYLALELAMRHADGTI